MQVSFPVQSTALQESGAIQTAKTATVASTQSSAPVQKKPAAQYFNPKISVDSKSGLVLVQYRSQDGDVRVQFPSEQVVSHYNAHGVRPYNRPDPVTISRSDDTAPTVSVEPKQAAPVTAGTSEAPAPQPQARPSVEIGGLV